MTLAIAWYYPNRIRCAVDIVGISNFVTFLENTESYRRDLRRVEYGDERDPEMRKFMERIAPVNNADKMKKPARPGSHPRVNSSVNRERVLRESGRCADNGLFLTRHVIDPSRRESKDEPKRIAAKLT
jgi:hypothetical protein